MATHVLTIPRWHPTKLNQLIGCHWGRASRLKKADRQMVAVYAKRACIPPATGKRQVMLHLTLALRQRAGDVDAYHKSLLDSLKHTGLIVDDNRQWCEIAPATFDRGKERATRIILVDLEETCSLHASSAD